MSAVITEIAREILDMQDGAADQVEDIETAVRLVLRGVYAAGYVVAHEHQEIRTNRVVDLEDLEV